MSDSDSDSDSDEFIATPVMEAQAALVTVPEFEIASIDPAPYGAVSVGSVLLPDTVNAVSLGLHHRDGRVLIAVLPLPNAVEFAARLTNALTRASNNQEHGEYAAFRGTTQ